MSTLSRRTFLHAGSLTLLGTALAACSKDPAPGPTPTGSGAGTTIDDVIAGRTQSLQSISVGTELLSGRPERLAFGIVDPEAQALVRDATGRIWFAMDRAEPAVGPIEMRFHGDGLPQDRGFYAAEVEFPADGQWLVLAEIERNGTTEIAAHTVQVGRRNGMPIPGERAPRVHTPTPDSARGVDPICTMVPEPCGMHRRSLRDLIDAKQKTVVIIATPAYCTSKLCGPEVEILDSLRADAKGISFVHIELLANDDPDTVQRTSPLSPAAIAFATSEEPAVYSILPDGRILDRVLGPGDEATFRDVIARLADA